jgi:hypothetical protein
VSRRSTGAIRRARGREWTGVERERCDREALGVLERFTHDRLAALGVLRPWMRGLSRRTVERRPIGALDYIVLLAIVRRDPLVDGPELEADRQRAARLLVTLRERLFGQHVAVDRVAQLRLPRRFLARQAREAQALHAAVFRRLDGRPSSAVLNLYAGYIPRSYDWVVALVFALVWVHPSTRGIAIGLLHGYLFGTLVEHLIHKHFGHATPQRVARFERVLTALGPAGRIAFNGVAAIGFRHGTVHHASYAASYVDPCGAKGGAASRKVRIDAMVQRRPAREVTDIVASGYGTSLAHPLTDALAIVAASAGCASIVLTAAGRSFSLLFVAASAVASLLFLAFSHWVHPYLHMRREAALAAAGPWMRVFLRSRYAAHIARAHYLHHRDASVNQNLAIGADFVLGYRMSSIESVLRLRAMGALY